MTPWYVSSGAGVTALSSRHPSSYDKCQELEGADVCLERRKRATLYLCIPAALVIIAFTAFPLINGIYVSFLKWNGYSQTRRFIGFENYVSLVGDPVFWRSLGNTLIYGFGSTILQNVFGLLIALYVNTKFAGRNFIRALVYMPIMISGFIMGLILYYFVQLQGGVINDMLAIVGLPAVYWMETGMRATTIVTLVNSWQYLGLCMVIYLAGLQNIPQMYLEAARIDGVNTLQEFFKIKLPMLMGSVTTAVIINLIGGFKLYEVIVSLSGGGPNRKSLSLSYYIQLLYFNDEKAGFASAVGVALFFIIFIISWPINKFLVKKVVEF